LENTRLSPLGIKQAERLRDRLDATREIHADVLISSTMNRAQHTAEIIAPALGLPITFDEEVEEWRDGNYENMTQEERQVQFKNAPLAEWPYIRIAPGAETWAEFNLRMGTALHRITQEHEGKTIVLVCHGGIIDGSFQLFFELSTLQFPRALLGGTRNTSITHWRKDTSEEYGIPPTWFLESYNDAMHLRDISSSVRIPWQAISAKPVDNNDKPEVPTDI
jgi:probable phosphoglycerate mutase